MISNIDAIRNIDIRDVVTTYIKLTKNKAKCPFHNEKSESFSINPKKQIFKCFGCGEGGDSFKFVMLKEQCSFNEAVEKIAEIGKIDVEYDKKDYDTFLQKKEIKKPLIDCIEWALSEYSKQFQQSDAAKEYAQLRSLSDEAIAKWGIGYAPDSWDFISKQIVGSKSPQFATEIGLIAVTEKTGKNYDRFRNRLIFPVCNEFGQPVSLSGRTIGKEDKQTPKTYKGNNSSIHEWSKTLFGLHHARNAIKNYGFAILVEGEMDVISMHNNGAENTVGSGTKLIVPDQCKLLKRFTDHVVLMPDNDEDKNGKKPGIDAASENLKILTACGFRVDIFFIPDNPDGKKQDPDDFAKSFINQPKNNK